MNLCKLALDRSDMAFNMEKLLQNTAAFFFGGGGGSSLSKMVLFQALIHSWPPM